MHSGYLYDNTWTSDVQDQRKYRVFGGFYRLSNTVVGSNRRQRGANVATKGTWL